MFSKTNLQEKAVCFEEFLAISVDNELKRSGSN